MVMQRRARLHKVQLIAYDIVDTPLWSLPLIDPSPTPIPPGDASPRRMRSLSRVSEASLYQVRLLRRVQLIPVDDF
jgi:hypothetical protein